VRAAASRQLTAALVLLALQAAAVVLAVRRDPVERFQGAVATALVWEASRRMR
jgi:hypothetical protein